MTYHDGQARETAKWAHDRLWKAQERAECEQRQELADFDDVGPVAPSQKPDL